MEIPRHELDKIADYVVKGITAARKNDSEFWGDVKVKLAVFDQRLINIQEKLDQIPKNTEDIQALKTTVKWMIMVGSTILVLGQTAIAFFK